MSAYFQQVEHGIYAGQVLEREVLVVECHPLLKLFDGYLLDVGKERHGDDDRSSIRRTTIFPRCDLTLSP